MKSQYLMLAVALLVVFASAANAFEMVLSTDTLIIHTGESRSIDVAVVSAADDVVVFASPIEESWISVPTHLIVNSSQQATATIRFSPFDKTEPKTYNFLLALQSIRTGERRERNLTIIVRSAQVAIEKMVISGALEPNGYGQLDIFIKNYENTTADVVLNVDAGEFLKFSEIVNLGPGEFTTVKRGFTIPECQLSGEYRVNANVEFESNRVFSSEQKFIIPEKFVPTITKNETASGFRTETVVTIKNTGNVNGVAEYVDRVLGALFFSGDKPAQTDDGFRWFVDLNACESRTIRYQIDYTPIPVAIFVVFALWYVFFRLRTVRVKKVILQKATIEKGIEFTVGTDVKSWVNAKDVEIHDFVPSLFEVRDTPGIKPIKRKTEAGTELLWKLKELKPYEERILDYKIVPLFGINGQVNLPRAIVSFTHLGRRITKRSLSTVLGLKLTEHVERVGDFTDRLGIVLKKALNKRQ